MHHYERNIGDYLRDASHLSLLEHGIYTRLLDIYYLNEKPLSPELKVIARQIGARTQDELDALSNVLNDFFQKTESGYSQKRCDKELEKIYEKSEKARQSAASRWGKTENASQEKCERNANAMPSHSERNANGMLPITHNPEEKEEANASSKKKASRINPDFELPDDWKAWALAETQWTPDAVAREFSRFRDYWVAKSGKDATKADWLATWRNWVRNAQDRQRAPPKQQTPLQAAHAAATAKMVERHNANLERATRLVHGLGPKDLPGAVDEKIRDAGNGEYLPRGVAGNA